ncbi:MAG: flagellar assembly protein FliX [Alphaproteobacteria bacterium]
MKVDGPGSSSNINKGKKTAKKGGSTGAAFSESLRGGRADADENVDSASGLAGGAALGSIDALLAIQGADTVDAADPDQKGGNRVAAEHGADLLDRLDDIRVALLTGRLSQGMLMNLRDTLSRRAEGATDAGLKSLIEDIELRVEVELAKYDRR